MLSYPAWSDKGKLKHAQLLESEQMNQKKFCSTNDQSSFNFDNLEMVNGKQQ